MKQKEYIHGNIISYDVQYGFCKAKSSVSNRLIPWVNLSDEKEYIHIIFLNVAKAFDTVP